MKSTFILSVFVLLISCKSTNTPASTEKPADIQKELAYIRARDSHIRYFKINLEKDETDSLKDLENKLKDVLKGCRIPDIPNQGRISLEALSEGVGFGMLDGMEFQRKDSTLMFCTSKRLFQLYFKDKKIKHLDNLSSSELTDIFQSALLSDAAITDFTSFKMDAPKGFLAYSMVGFEAQDDGPYPPNELFVLIMTNEYVYMAEKGLKDGQITNPAECQKAWDIPISQYEKELKIYDASGANDTVAQKKADKLRDKAWDDYCKCYRKTLSKTEQFKIVQKQLEELAQDIEN